MEEEGEENFAPFFFFCSISSVQHTLFGQYENFPAPWPIGTYNELQCQSAYGFFLIIIILHLWLDQSFPGKQFILQKVKTPMREILKTTTKNINSR